MGEKQVIPAADLGSGGRDAASKWSPDPEDVRVWRDRGEPDGMVASCP